MDVDRQTWAAAIRLATAISVVAALATVAVASAGTVPIAAVVAPIVAVAFMASWVQTGRIRRTHLAPVTSWR